MAKIGIDLGGTKLRAAVLSEEFEVVEWFESLSEVQRGPAHTIALMISMIHQGMEKHSISGIGIGAPGPLDNKKGILLESPNFPGWKEVSIVDELSNVFSLPIQLNNDAQAAALAEAIKGNGKGYESVWYTTVSTGIGSGFVINERLFSGAAGCAGEIGNMIIQPGGREQSNLNAGALEAYASGTAIGEIAKERYNWQGGAAEVMERAIKGNAEAIGLVDETIGALAIGIANIVHTINPAVFVIGGGVMKHHDYLLPLLRHKTIPLLYPSMVSSFKLVPAALQEEAGVIGAALLVNHS
ncbi:ROK family protein [Jeotgalibacillus soli]|uniref:Glucokinase n=1 Tax=Jeotgalibacillus soli TaxID=889306 RepID=A0A0C2VN01_9BACL|nr:ROK family protein [Jeotgalibacillus soli]KIL45831.1 hypothetical protein KP78_21800 [Jeotgalibacillus soli]